MSWHDLISAQTSNVCITHHAVIACMCQTICDATSSNVLGRLVQYKQKGWDRGRWVGIHTQRVKNSQAVCGFSCKNPSVGSLSKWSWKESSHLTEPPCSVQVWFINIELASIA